MAGGTDGPRGQVVRLRLNAARAQSRIRAAVADSSNILFSDHARVRMRRRGFDDIDVLRILTDGVVEDDPTDGRDGEWKCKVVKKMAGGRTAGVVTIIMVNGRLWVKTVEWEDGR